jgi:hypothetical protein
MFSKWRSLIIPFSGSGQYGIPIGIGIISSLSISVSVSNHSSVYSNGLAVSIYILSECTAYMRMV